MARFITTSNRILGNKGSGPFAEFFSFEIIRCCEDHHLPPDPLAPSVIAKKLHLLYIKFDNEGYLITTFRYYA